MSGTTARPKEPSQRYLIEVRTLPRAPMGVGRRLTVKGLRVGKLVKRMRREAVNCPVQKKVVPFVECYACKNFIRRVRGKVHCRGSPIS